MNKRGFTLVEIMVAMVILALISTGVFSVMLSARYLVQRSKRRLIAIEIAKREIENKRQFIRADTWYTPGNPLDDTGAWSGWTPAASGPYSYEWRYRVDPGPPGLECRQMTIQVMWSEQKI